MTTTLKKDLKFLENLLEAAGEKEASELQRVEALLNKIKLLQDLDITVLDRAIEFQKSEVATAIDLIGTYADEDQECILQNSVGNCNLILSLLQKLRDIHD